MDISQKIIEIINGITNKKDMVVISKKQSLTKLGIDSITFIKIIIKVEQEFDIRFPNSELIPAKLDDVEHISTLVELCLSKK